MGKKRSDASRRAWVTRKWNERRPRLDDAPCDFSVEMALRRVRNIKLDSKRFPYHETAPLCKETVPRYYQTDAAEMAMDYFGAGETVVLIEMCTGSGKTKVAKLIAAKMLDTMCQAVLVVTHKVELENQFRGQYERGLDSPSRHNEPDGHAKIHTATSQELVWARRNNRPLFNKLLRRYDLIIIDEVQHYPEGKKRAWGGVANEFRKAGVRILGLSATVIRHDKLPVIIPDFRKYVVYGYPIEQGVEDRYLCEVESVTVSTHLKPRTARWKGGNLELSFKKADAVQRNRTIRDTLSEIRSELGRVPQTVVFVSRVEEARQLSLLLNRSGALGVSTYVHGGLRVAERERIYRRFEEGKINVIVNVQVTTEGVDLPTCDLVAMARPTRSRPLYFQMLGRGTRAPKGKEFLLVVDFVDNLELQQARDIVVLSNLRDAGAGISGGSWIRQKRETSQTVDITGVSLEWMRIYSRYRPFDRARDFVRKLVASGELTVDKRRPKKTWSQFCKSGKPRDIPSNPKSAYAEWTDWWDWYGMQPRDWAMHQMRHGDLPPGSLAACFDSMRLEVTVPPEKETEFMEQYERETGETVKEQKGFNIQPIGPQSKATSRKRTVEMRVYGNIRSGCCNRVEELLRDCKGVRKKGSTMRRPHASSYRKRQWGWQLNGEQVWWRLVRDGMRLGENRIVS